MIHFTVEGPPIGKERPRTGRGGHFYTPRRTQAYEARIASAFRQACPFPCPWHATRIRMKCFFASHRRPDLDNVLKCLLDGLAGLAYPNDRQVSKCEISLAVDNARPRLEVEVA